MCVKLFTYCANLLLCHLTLVCRCEQKNERTRCSSLGPLSTRRTCFLYPCWVCSRVPSGFAHLLHKDHRLLYTRPLLLCLSLQLTEERSPAYSKLLLDCYFWQKCWAKLAYLRLTHSQSYLHLKIAWDSEPT